MHSLYIWPHNTFKNGLILVKMREKKTLTFTKLSKYEIERDSGILSDQANVHRQRRKNSKLDSTPECRSDAIIGVSGETSRISNIFFETKSEYPTINYNYKSKFTR